LAYTIREGNGDDTSNNPNGERKIWGNIWKVPVPNKVRVFSWRLASDNLPTQRNKWRRTLETQNTCPICGNGIEDSFHATVECTKAKALRHKMRDYWQLPSEKKFSRTGKDWLLVLLDNTNKRMHQAILMVLWRAWELRNDIYHKKGNLPLRTLSNSSFLMPILGILKMQPLKKQTT
jgi:hypothetical protein